MLDNIFFALDDVNADTLEHLPTFSLDESNRGEDAPVVFFTEGLCFDNFELINTKMASIEINEVVDTTVPQVSIKDGLQLGAVEDHVLSDNDELLYQVARLELSDTLDTSTSIAIPSDVTYSNDTGCGAFMSSVCAAKPQRNRTRHRRNEPYQGRSARASLEEEEWWTQETDIASSSNSQMTRAERRRTEKYLRTERARATRIKVAQETTRQRWMDIELHMHSLIAFKHQLQGAYSATDLAALAASARALNEYQDVATAENKERASQLEERLRKMRC